MREAQGEKPRQKQKKGCLKCTGCNRGADSEHIHPALKVPVCGICFNSYNVKRDREDLIERDKTGHENAGFCIWCKKH